MIPLQLPSYEEKKSNIEEIYLKLNTSHIHLYYLYFTAFCIYVTLWILKKEF